LWQRYANKCKFREDCLIICCCLFGGCSVVIIYLCPKRFIFIFIWLWPKGVIVVGVVAVCISFAFAVRLKPENWVTGACFGLQDRVMRFLSLCDYESDNRNVVEP